MRIELTQQSGLEVNQLSAADMTPAMAERMEAVIAALFPADKEGENTSTAEQ